MRGVNEAVFLLNKGELDAETSVVDAKTTVALSNISAKRPNKGCVGVNMAVGRVIEWVVGVQNGDVGVNKGVVLLLILGSVFPFLVIFVR